MDTVTQTSVADITAALDQQGIKYYPYQLNRDPETGRKTPRPLGHTKRANGEGMSYTDHKHLYDRADAVAVTLDGLTLVDIDDKEGAPSEEELTTRFDLGQAFQRHPDKPSIHWLYRDDPVLASNPDVPKSFINFDGTTGVDVLRTERSLMFIDVAKQINLKALEDLTCIPSKLEKALTKAVRGRSMKRSEQQCRDARPSLELSEASETLSRVDPNCDYETWIKVLMGIYSEFGDTPEAVDLADQWSQGGDSYEGPESIQAKFDSFTPDGDVTWGTVVHYAGGYDDWHTPLTLEQAQLLDWDWFEATVEQLTGEAAKLVAGDCEEGIDEADFVAHDNEFLVDGLIEEGVVIFSGEKGVGKTSAFLPIAAVMAGLLTTKHLKATDYRQVYYLTEDTGQACRIRKAMWQNGEFGEMPYSDVVGRLKIQPARRGPPSAMVKRMNKFKDDVVVHYDDNGQPFEVLPVVVIDTVNANIAKPEGLQDPVSALMAELKENLRGMSLLMIHHTAKRGAGQKAAAMTAHGEQAWESDANQSGILLKEDTGDRMLQITKHRIAGDVPATFVMQTEKAVARLQNRRGRVREAPVYYSLATPLSEEEARLIREKRKEQAYSSKHNERLVILFSDHSAGDKVKRMDVLESLNLNANTVGDFENYAVAKGLISVSQDWKTKYWSLLNDPRYDTDVFNDESA